MNKRIYVVILFLTMVAFGGFMVGCGQEPTSTTATGTSLTDAINSDTSLFDVGPSETSLSTEGITSGLHIMSGSEEGRDYSWYRTFNNIRAISITILTQEGSTAEAEVTREATGVLYVNMTSGSQTTSESFDQEFTRFISLESISGNWRIKSVTQGISRSLLDSAGASPNFNSATSDITIDGVSIVDSNSGITFNTSQQPSAIGPWIDYSNIATTDATHTLTVIVTVEQIGNSSGPVPYVFIWPDLAATIFRHQLTYISLSSPFTYTYSFTVPSGLSGRKRMTIGAFDATTLTSEEAEMGAYDFTSWHIPYKVE